MSALASAAAAWESSGDPVYMLDLLWDFGVRGIIPPPDPRQLHGAICEILDACRADVPSLPHVFIGASVGLVTETMLFEQKPDGGFETPEHPMVCCRRIMTALHLLGFDKPEQLAARASVLRKYLPRPFGDVTSVS